MELYSFSPDYVRRLCDHEAEVEEHFSAYFGELMLIKLRARRVPTADIHDLIQDTFLRTFEKLCGENGLRRAESLGAFVNSICNNVWHEYTRRKRADPLPDDFNEKQSEENQETDLITAERNRAVRRALNELPEKDRHVLDLLFMKEETSEETSRQLGIKPDYLRVRVFRVKKLLKRRFLRKKDTEH